MPVGLEPCAVVRRVNVVRGSVAFRDGVPPGFDYARPDHRVTIDDPRVAFFTAADAVHRARLQHPLTTDGPAAYSPLPPRRGPGAWFVLAAPGCGPRWEDETVARCHRRDP